jgi:hypothetical protein
MENMENERDERREELRYRVQPLARERDESDEQDNGEEREASARDRAHRPLAKSTGAATGPVSRSRAPGLE